MSISLPLAVAAILISSLGPGFFLLRRVEMSAEERITASVGLSLLLIYLSCFLIFLLRLPIALYNGILVLAAGLLLVSGRDLIRFLENQEARRLLLGFGVLAVWSLALLSLIRTYSGDNWYGDWLEHYQRSLFFLDRPDPSIHFQGDYKVPARPPFMNVLCGYFMVIAGREYPVYQLISTILSILIFFPARLLIRYFSPSRRASPMVLVAFLMFNPLVVQNSTYSWTKLLAVFYVLAGVSFYLRGWHQKEGRWTLAAFASLSCGLLAHYSAGPYTVFLAGHYLLFVFPSRKSKWIEISAIFLVVLLILVGWFGYSFTTFGKGTVTSTTSYFEAASLTGGQNVAKIFGNIRDSFVPHLMRGVGTVALGPGLFWGALRDAAFKLYQFNLLFALGSIGAVLLAFAVYQASRDDLRLSSRDRWFWLALPAVCVVVGIGVQGERYNLGLTHITLQPLAILGVAFLAARFCHWPRSVRWMAVGGLMVDFLLGIALHFKFQTLTFGERLAGQSSWGITSKDLLVGSAWANWKLKRAQGLVYLGDLWVGWGWVLWSVLVAICAVGLFVLAREAANRPQMPDAARGDSPRAAPKGRAPRAGRKNRQRTRR